MHSVENQHCNILHLAFCIPLITGSSRLIMFDRKQRLSGGNMGRKPTIGRRAGFSRSGQLSRMVGIQNTQWDAEIETEYVGPSTFLTRLTSRISENEKWRVTWLFVTQTMIKLIKIFWNPVLWTPKKGDHLNSYLLSVSRLCRVSLLRATRRFSEGIRCVN